MEIVDAFYGGVQPTTSTEEQQLGVAVDEDEIAR